RKHLYSNVPIYTTRLVREALFSFPERIQTNTPAGIAAVLQDYFSDKDREEFVACLLDAPGTLLGIARISQGGLSSAPVEARQVFKAAILANAAGIILAHQHPSGNPEPSAADLKVTRQLVAAGKVMDIPVFDHLVITDTGYTSLAERGLIP